jgi:hypothetical protein
MAIEIERLNVDHLVAVRKLRQSQSPDDWPEELSDEYFRWRYSAREQSETLLAFDGDRCVAMLDSSSHAYRFGDSITSVREPCEWLCLPDYRPLGLGLRLMGMFMKEPEPMFAMVGTWMTQDILPRMGWRKLPDTVNYTLPLTSGALADSLLGRLRLPVGGLRTRLAHTISVPVWHRRSKAPTGDSAISEHQPGDLLPLVEPSADYGLACICSPWEPAWLCNAPQDMGQFYWLVATADGKPVGLTISRLFRQHGASQANLLHLQTRQRSPELYEWLITETARFLAEQGAAKVSCRASCPTFSTALKHVGFIERSRTPAFWWSKDGSDPSGPLHLTQWRADESIRPYPCS